MKKIAMTEDKTQLINDSITNYFAINKDKEWVSVKALMPFLIEKGLFNRDKKNGQPIRKVLRDLDQDNKLNLLPNIHAERVKENIYWYAVKDNCKYVSSFSNEPTKKEIREKNKINSDEYYLLNLCDELTGKKSSRQHTFKHLLGDVHSDGKSQTKLALDAFYKELSLVLELYRTGNPARPSSGLNDIKAEKRKIYDQRKKSFLEEKGINLIHIDYNDFESIGRKLARKTDKDIDLLKDILKDYIH